jgi:hypothetical protein
VKTLGLAFTLAASLASAQETGGIGGVVTDATGAVLPDCVVAVESENGVVSRKQRTGVRGGYGFSGLQAGSYSVRFDLAGFDSARREGVRVEAGTHVELRVTLQVQGLAVFTGVGSTDRKRTGLAEIAETSLLQGVPTGRSLWSVLELTPGLVTDRIDVGGSASGQQSTFSASGTSATQNQYYLNGVNVTDPTALGASASYYSYDAFEEVRVSTAAHDAETQPPGVVLNIVLKGGGNQLEGGASFYFENDVLQSDNLDDRLRAQGVPPSNPLESFYDLSAELGGPIARDHAFFYASYARQRIAPFAIGFFLPGGEPGVDRTDLSTVVARTSLSLESRGSLGFLFFQNRKLRPYRDAGRFRPTPATALHQDSTTGVVQGLYSRLLGDKALLDARFSLVDLDFPLGEDPELPDDAYSRIELASGVRSGGPGSDELFSRNRRQANAALFLFADDWLSGSHDVKLGWEGGWNRASTGYDLTGAILYRDFFGAPIQVEVYSEPLTTVNDASSQGFFVKDSYVRGRLVLNLGARFDRWTAGYPDQSRSAGPWEDLFRARGLPESTAGDGGLLSFSSIAPRLGFTYSLTSDGRTILRGSGSRFYHQIGTDLISSQNPNGRAAALFRFGDENRNRVLDPGEIDLETPLAVSLPALNEIDPEIAQPRTDELSLGLDREMGSGLTLSVTLLYRKDRKLIDDVNVGVPAIAFEEGEALDPGRDLAMGTADDAVVPVFNQSRETLGQDRFQLTNPEGLESRYRGIVFEADKRAQRWQVKASLSLSESEGYLPGPGLESQVGAPSATPLFNDPNTLTNALGRTFWDRPRILRLSGFYEWKWGMRFASAYRYQTGQPMYRSILVSATLEGVPLAQGPVEILAEPQGAAIQPSVHLLDVRAEKEFSLGNAGRLALVFDLFNSFNANTATEVSSRRGAFGAILEVLPPRVARIGVRYRFGSK